MKPSWTVTARQRRHHTGRPAGWRLLAAVAMTGLLLTTAACSDDKPTWKAGGPSAAPSVPQVKAAITDPTADEKDVEPLTQIAFTTENADKAEVEVKDSSGKVVEGKTADDGLSWTPSKALAWGGTYTATITVTGLGGKTGTTTSSFTVKSKPDKVIKVSSFLGDGRTVGVGMPMIVKFDRSVPKAARGEVQKHLKLESTPAQEGTWAWYNDKEIHYRPKDFWQANTKVKYSAQLQGVSLGDGWYGAGDWTVDLKIGRAFVMSVDDNTKQMTITQDGNNVKTIPVSLGKASTPSSSGTMVIMEKSEHTRFNTMNDPNPSNRYDVPIDFAQRLTYNGEFIHAAPWSEGKQGRENVSHGCVNISEKEGAWLFGQTMLGDPITVKNTGRTLNYGNGWTDWSKSWDEYKKGSAL